MVEFISKYKNHVLVLTPVRKKEIEGEIVFTDGRRIEFSNFTYKTDEQEVIDRLREHKMYNVSFFEAPDKDALDVSNSKDEKEEESDKGEVFKCDNAGCDFETTAKIGLIGHKRKCSKQKQKVSF